MVDPAQVHEAIRERVRDLPVLPAAVTRLLTLSQQADVSVGEITGVIETDPTLMARTLRVANSPLHGVARPVKTAQRAAVLLGIEAIVHLTLGVAVASVQSQLYERLPIDAEAFGRHNIGVALAARKLARHALHLHPGEAFVAGLLHDIGKLVLLMHFGDAYAGLMARAGHGEKALHDLEREALAIDHAGAGHALCLHWNIPASMTEAVAVHHAAPAPNTLGAVVQQANTLVKTIRLGYSGNRFIPAPVGEPGELAGQGWLRRVILDLYEEIDQAEEALGHTPGSRAPSRQQARPVVQLQITRPDDEALLTSMLLALGFEPSALTDVSVFDGPDRPVALVTDSPPSGRQRQAYQELGVSVLDYAAFRREHGNAEGAALDVYLLGAWLSGLATDTTPLP